MANFDKGYYLAIPCRESAGQFQEPVIVQITYFNDKPVVYGCGSDREYGLHDFIFIKKITVTYG